MINTLARTKKSELLINVPFERLSEEDIMWYWVDFEVPPEEETTLLSTYFKFHDLSIKDCTEHLERPKVDYYEDYSFFVLHAINQITFEPIEVDLFIGENYVVSFCKSKLQEIEHVRQKLLNHEKIKEERAAYVAYLIFDKIVDFYFPIVYGIEDALNVIDISVTNNKIHNLIDQVFEIRTKLLKLRHIVNSMKELMYRMLNSGHLEDFRESKRRFNDIYDHLLQLSDIIESNREVTSDVRDNYLSINSHKMNKIMTILTIITSIFIPLTFIAGIYGMNFENMPELRWKYGYFYVLGVMALIFILMLLWFKRKGWFDIKK